MADECIGALRVQRDLACNAIIQVADTQAYQHDKRRRAILYKVGDEVLLNPHSLELMDVKGTSHKLMQWRIGPFEITEVPSPSTYRLRLPDTMPIHNVVNLEHLTLYQRSQDKDNPRLQNPWDDLKASEEYEVESILDLRYNWRKWAVEFLVCWHGSGPEHNSWQSSHDLCNTPEALKVFKGSQNSHTAMVPVTLLILLAVLAGVEDYMLLSAPNMRSHTDFKDESPACYAGDLWYGYTFLSSSHSILTLLIAQLML
jgi:Chromo (CHRromatin Organisation MOdifier) domain